MKYWIFVLYLLSASANARVIDYSIELTADFFDDRAPQNMSGQISIDTDATEHYWADFVGGWLIPSLYTTVSDGNTTYLLDMSLEIIGPETLDPWSNLNGRQESTYSIQILETRETIAYASDYKWTIITTAASVPEPTTLALLGLGLIGFARPFVKRRHIRVT